MLHLPASARAPRSIPRRLPTWGHLASLALIALTACGGPPPPPPPVVVAPEPVVVRDPLLQWNAEGDQIIVDGRWRLKVDTGTFSPVGAPDPTVPPALSPTGLAAVFEPGLLTILGGRQIKLPGFFDPPAAGVTLTGYWLDRSRIYLQAWNPERKTSACRVFDLTRNGLIEPAGCITGEYPEIVRLQGGPGDLVAVHTRDGETPGVRFVRYSPESGQQAVAVPPIDLRPAGPLTLGFHADGANVALVSPCLLDQPRPCSAPPTADGRHGLYVLDLARGHMSARIALVVPGTAPAPDGRRLAWVAGDKVCVGSPRTPGAVWCHRLPQ